MASGVLARAWRVGAVVTVVVAAGCGGGGGGGAGPDRGALAGADEVTTTSQPSTTTTRMVACVAGDLDPRSLAPVVVEEVPGFSRETDDVGNTGPSDLAKAIRDDGERDAERVLNETGFRAGYQRLWTNEAGDELVLFVYEFCRDDGAERYASRTIDIFEAARLPIQPIVGPDVGTGFTLVSESQRGLWLWETAGPALVMVATFAAQAEEPTSVLERATGLLAAQLDRLATSETAAV
jgi:hypothetical protein